MDIINEALTELNEDINSSLPVTRLGSDDILEFVSTLPKAGPGVPPKHFKLGYISRIEPAARFRADGRGHVDKETGEVLPEIAIYKCGEYSGCYIEPYTSAKATKAAFKAQGRDLDDVLPRRGYHPAYNVGVRGIFESDSGKGLAVGPLIDKNSTTKCKYYVSIDGGDLVETPKQDVAQYMPNPQKFMEPRPEADASSPEAQRTQTFLFSGIYLLGDKGHAIL